jgi:hypothetical protein
MKSNWVIDTVDGSRHFYRGSDGWFASETPVGVCFTHAQKNIQVFHPWTAVKVCQEEGWQ